MRHSFLYCFRFVLIVLTTGSFLVGCDATSTPVEDAEPVVEAYLIADDPLPRIRLTRTADIASGYSASALAIRNATVRLTLEGVGESPDDTYIYVHSAAEPGIYEPAVSAMILPGRAYLFSAAIESTGEEITASTTIPTNFKITDITSSTVVYQGDTQYSINITDSQFPGRRAIYVQSIRALEPDPCELTPLYLLDIYDVNEGEEYDCTTFDPLELDHALLNASPPLNEQSYETNLDGTIVVPLPWFAVAFYGDALVGTAAVDDAIYDFMRYQNVQTDGSTLSPGEIPNVLDHVNGGRGIFGGMARVESIMTVIR